MQWDTKVYSKPQSPVKTVIYLWSVPQVHCWTCLQELERTRLSNAIQNRSTERVGLAGTDALDYQFTYGCP